MYFGSTNDLMRRLKEHNAGVSQATSRYKPWKYAYVEGYALKEDALGREEKIKQFGKVYAQLKRRIIRSLRSA